MTEPTPRAHLLPGDATPAERAVAAVDGRIDDIDAGLIVAVLDPATCPAYLLPYLAWQRSVDVWDASWPEAIKRAVIAAAPTVHRLKGTRAGIEAALAALQVDVSIVEWFERTPQAAPYTFRARAYARARLYDGPVLDARLIGVVHAAIMRSKPLSRAFDLTIGATFPRSLGLAAVATARVRARFVARPRLDLASAAPLGLAPVLLARVVVRRSVLLRGPE